ncbi:MAG: sensor histidine kinase [Turicibacter sp.]
MEKVTTKNANIAKFLLCALIFLMSFSYVIDNIYRIIPFNYFDSNEYTSATYEFLHSFNDLEIELPKVKIPLEDIQVTKEEILDFRYDNTDYSFNYYEYTGDGEGDYETQTEFRKSLTDEQITEIIAYEKYRQNERIANDYYYSNYSYQNAFYYTLTDRNGKTYSNLPSDPVPTLNKVNVPMISTDYSDRYYNSDSYGLTGTLYLPKTPLGTNIIHSQYQDYIATQITWGICLAIAIIVIFPGKHYFKTIKSYNFEIPESLKWVETRYLTLPIEVRGLIYIWSFMVVSNINFRLYYLNNLLYNLMSFAFEGVILGFFILQSIGVYNRIKNLDLIQEEWHTGLYHSNIEEFRKHPAYRKVFTNVLVYTIIIGAWGIAIGISFVDVGSLFIIGGLSIVIAFMLLMTIKKRTKLAQKVMDTVHQMALGQPTTDIIVKNHGLVADMARDVNCIKEGVKISTQKQSQSERMKTELITNVSHDLRTPLTSILNYVDLAKRDDLTDEERKEYLEILDTKSKRLKVLIDDLFEASKMASGAVEIYKERVDLVSLMHQSIAEYEDRFTASNLVLRTKTSDAHMFAYVDGRKMYRVFENLLNNASKYSQPGTRVYFEMVNQGTKIIVSIKNVSNYELGFDIVELTERFKRGDDSRHTEGTGLGLSIVKSILDLHEADFELSQDGDLFKATFSIEKL